MRWITYGWVLIFLAICAFQDLKTKEIKARTLIFGGAISLGLAIAGIIMGTTTLISSICGLLPGGFMLLFARVTKGKIGMGDGLVLCICGAVLGGLCSVTCLFYGLLLTAFCSMVLMAFRKLRLSGSLPFVPFLFCGTVIGVLMALTEGGSG